VKPYYGVLADFMVFVHLLYVLFAVGGQAFILIGAVLRSNVVRGPVFRICHLVAVGLVTIEAATGVNCPLTLWEYDLRKSAGQTFEESISFIGRLVRLIIYYDFPHWVFTVMHIAFGLLVVLTFVLIPPRFGKTSPEGAKRGTAGYR
jgi:hypothetical protein